MNAISSSHRQPPVWPLPDEAVEDALRRAFADGSWGKYHGPNCRELSDRLTASHECEHVLLACSGTAAIELALRGLRVGAGDEVILSAYDFEGNFKNVLAVGGKPVLLDIDPVTGQLDVEQLETARSDKTKAIIASHLHGGVVNMPAVRTFADRHHIAVIEDACQMPGAMIHGRIAGRWGDIGVLSFGGSKLLTAGRGGCLFTADANIAQRVRLHTQRGNDAYPLSELQAAVLVPQWDRLSERNQLRTANVTRLIGLLAGQRGLRCFVESGNSCALQPVSDKGLTLSIVSQQETRPGFYKLGFWYDAAQFGGRLRDDFACAMRVAGVALDPGFRALHRTHARSRFRSLGDLPNASRADESVLVLHHPALLGDAADMQAIATAIELASGDPG